jgi:hypothetical protein
VAALLWCDCCTTPQAWVARIVMKVHDAPAHIS